MLAIKFKRVGKKHQASFRIIVGEKRSKVQGRFVEDLGWFDPRTDKYKLLASERILYWIKVGAKPTPSVYNLFIRAGVIKGKKIPVHKKPKKKEMSNSNEVMPPAGAAAAAAT